MDNITDVYNIAIVISSTNLISYTTVFTNNIYYNNGTIFVSPIGLMPNFDPIRVLASLMIFLLIGVFYKKTLNMSLIWLGLTMTGVLNLASVYIQFSILLCVSIFLIYKTYHSFKKV